MKIDFGDSSYIELVKNLNGKIVIILSAKDGKNPKNTIINSVELSGVEFSKLISEVVE